MFTAQVSQRLRESGMLLSFALAYRFKLLKDEKERMQREDVKAGVGANEILQPVYAVCQL